MTQEIPQGFCQCGCGRPINLARRTSIGYTQGEPLNYIWVFVKKRCVVTSPSMSSILLPEDKKPHISGHIHPRKQGWEPAGVFHGYLENSGIQESSCGAAGPEIEVFETPEHLMLDFSLLARKDRLSCTCRPAPQAQGPGSEITGLSRMDPSRLQDSCPGVRSGAISWRIGNAWI